MLADRLKQVNAAIAAAASKAGRDPDAVKLVAVTKTVRVDQVRRAVALGLRDFGENRLQEAKDKVDAFPDQNWHFIGHLQTNKVKEVLPRFTLIHSLDRFSLAEALQRWGERLAQSVNVLVQVNVAREKGKYGLDPGELPDFLAALRSLTRIKVSGLMTMAPWVDDPEEARPVFKGLRLLQQQCSSPEMSLDQLSMGMTNDYRVAVEEGATMVRVGTALFGPRG